MVWRKRRRKSGGISANKMRLICAISTRVCQYPGGHARAIQAVVDPFGRADIEAGDDEADVEAERGRLNTGDGAPFAMA
jgi:hypothetical protein